MEMVEMEPMEATLDVAAAIRAIFWPLVVLIALIIYRKQIFALVKELSNRVSKFEIAGFAFDLAIAKRFDPDWGAFASSVDLRRMATSVQITDNVTQTFLSQLKEDIGAEYAEVNLGLGNEWLSSRLYILSIIYARMKGIRYFLFVENSQGVRRRYIGWTEASKLRFALAQQCPWLEPAFAQAYDTVMTQGVIVSNQGEIKATNPPNMQDPSTQLLTLFLEQIQKTTTSITPGEDGWISVDDANIVMEHAVWITGEWIKSTVDDDLNRFWVSVSDLNAKDQGEQVRLFLRQQGRYVAVVADDQKFKYLVDRDMILEKLAATFVSAKSQSS